MRDRRKQKTKLEKMPMSKRADRPGGLSGLNWKPDSCHGLGRKGRKVRQEGVRISGSMIRLKAKSLR